MNSQFVIIGQYNAGVTYIILMNPSKHWEANRTPKLKCKKTNYSKKNHQKLKFVSTGATHFRNFVYPSSMY